MRRSPTGRASGFSRIERTLVSWTPCMVTAVRLVLAPIIAYLFVHQFVITAVALFALAAWTDWLDGFLARTLRAESDFGAFFDATSDKVLILSFLFAAGYVAPPVLNWWRLGYLHAIWVLAVIEAALTALRLPRLFIKQVNVHAGKMGKWKFGAEAATVFEIMLFGSAELLPLAIALGILSLTLHLVHFRKS